MTIDFRHATAADHPFVIDNWISSFRTAHTAGLILMDEWHDTMWRTVDRILTRPYVRTLLAVDPDDSAFFYGFLTYEEPGPYVYYCYTKQPFRRGSELLGAGVAGSLFIEAGIDPTRTFGYACKTPMCSRLASKIPGGRWDPLAARFERKQAA